MAVRSAKELQSKGIHKNGQQQAYGQGARWTFSLGMKSNEKKLCNFYVKNEINLICSHFYRFQKIEDKRAASKNKGKFWILKNCLSWSEKWTKPILMLIADSAYNVICTTHPNQILYKPVNVDKNYTNSTCSNYI